MLATFANVPIEFGHMLVRQPIKTDCLVGIMSKPLFEVSVTVKLLGFIEEL